MPEEYPRLRPGQILFTYLHLAAVPELARALQKSRTIAIAYETVQRADGSLPLLTPMSEVAGRLAVQEGAFHLGKAHGGRGILLSGVPGVPPGNVVILGAGTVGSTRLKIAVGLGARRLDPRHEPRPAAPRRRSLPRPGDHGGLQQLQHRPAAPAAPISWWAPCWSPARARRSWSRRRRWRR